MGLLKIHLISCLYLQITSKLTSLSLNDKCNIWHHILTIITIIAKLAVVHPCLKKKNEGNMQSLLQNNLPEFSSDLRMSDFLKVYPMKLVSVDVNICKSHINTKNHYNNTAIPVSSKLIIIIINE